MPCLSLIKTDYTYANPSISISPAIERALEEGKSFSSLVLNIFCEDSFTVGMQEDPEKSLNLDFCGRNEIVVRRRQNPGGAVFGAKGSVINCFYIDLDQPWVPFKSVKYLRHSRSYLTQPQKSTKYTKKFTYCKIK